MHVKVCFTENVAVVWCEFYPGVIKYAWQRQSFNKIDFFFSDVMSTTFVTVEQSGKCNKYAKI